MAPTATKCSVCDRTFKLDLTEAPDSQQAPEHDQVHGEVSYPGRPCPGSGEPLMAVLGSTGGIVKNRGAGETWIVTDPDGRQRMVTPADRAAVAEREISDGWRGVAAVGDFEQLVSWVLQVGEKHGWPLDEAWVRDTFGHLAQST